MITVEQAIIILKENIPKSIKIHLSLIDAHQQVLAEDVISPINMPPFRQSAMDGFALNMHEGLTYKIIGEVKAGDYSSIELRPGEAIKIFTGAAVPNSANSVIQIEKTTVNNETLLLNEVVKPNTNIRQIGEQIKINEIALTKSTQLNAAAIGFLASLGITQAKVYKKPSVGILVTGNELVKPGNDLPLGKIYESNSIMLQAALHESGIKNCAIYEAKDDLEGTIQSIQKALNENEIILITGGISVGDYDFVQRALDELSVETLFYKVNQKPGKPLLVGKIKHKLIFALPGNPAASLICFYVYVKPTINLIVGELSSSDIFLQKTIDNNFTVNSTKSQFLKAKYTEESVTILTHQNSSMLNTFALANCIVHLPEGNYELKQGSKVQIYSIL